MPKVKDEPCEVVADGGAVHIDCHGAIVSLTPPAAHLTAEMIHDHGHKATEQRLRMPRAE